MAKRARPTKRRRALGARYSTHASTATRQSDHLIGDLSSVKHDVPFERVAIRSSGG
jgi:hypothetical protein